MARGLIKALGVAGAALTAWYFLDPKKGAERRGNFAKSTKDIYDSAADEIGRLGKDLAGGVSGVVSKVSEMTGLAGGGSESSSHSGSDKTSAQSAASSRSENYSAPISA